MNSTLIARNAKKQEELTPAERIQRRKLIFQDGVALLSLTLITLCIALLTYFFFSSFREHRRVLEKRWFARGEEALTAGHPVDAVEAFRSALTLSSGNANYELALAQALAAAGRTDEAYAYFSTLRDTEPGDGFLNLQLARLDVRRKDSAQAIEFYRSALNGAWHGHGTERRLHIRLELAKYLLSLGKITEAQGELLTAEGNSLDNPSELFEIASLLQQANDPSDAWTAYQRIARHSHASPSLIAKSLLAEAPIATSMGQYKRAALSLDRYNTITRLHPAATTPEEKQAAMRQLAHLQRMLQLIPFYGLQPRQHALRMLLEARIAHKRYASCAAKLQAAGAAADTAAMDALGTQWQPLGSMDLKTLAADTAAQQNMLAWVQQTEILTAKLCGQPHGDDALLLQLAQTPDKTE